MFLSTYTLQIDILYSLENEQEKYNNVFGKRLQKEEFSEVAVS